MRVMYRLHVRAREEMRMLQRASRLFVYLIVVNVFFVPTFSFAAQTNPSGEIQICLGCHGIKGFEISLKYGETLPLYVDESQFKNSVHRTFDCSGCHTGFSAQNHPSRKLNTKREYAISGALLCGNCHSTFRSELHTRMTKMAREGGKVCVDCHGAHAITPVSKVASKSSEYCLGCHSNELTMGFADGDAMSVRIESERLRLSVHNKLYCSDCHFGFSPEEHPVRTFRSRRDFTLTSSESCRRCHFDKYTKTLESIHYAMLSQGNLKAPVCVDCHGSHSISQTHRDRTTSARRCKTCHTEIYNTYSVSIHGTALFQEHNQDVPVCANCHRAHDIEDPRTFDYREQIPHMCGNCHANRELMDRYNLTTDVLKSYLQDFHGVTLRFYGRQKEAGAVSTFKPIAACIDCHGIHDITTTTGPGSSVVKTKLVKRCQKCHPDATADFPDSWISHYKPSLKRAPLVFTINLIYKIFIPFMMVGLILQILLHIWRYTVNR